MSAYKDWLDVIRTVLILLEAIIVLVWMDINWNQIITLVQVMIITIILLPLPMSYSSFIFLHNLCSFGLINNDCKCDTNYPQQRYTHDLCVQCQKSYMLYSQKFPRKVNYPTN